MYSSFYCCISNPNMLKLKVSSLSLPRASTPGRRFELLLIILFVVVFFVFLSCLFFFLAFFCSSYSFSPLLVFLQRGEPVGFGIPGPVIDQVVLILSACSCASSTLATVTPRRISSSRPPWSPSRKILRRIIFFFFKTLLLLFVCGQIKSPI